MLQKIVHKCSKKIVMHGVSISRHIKPISDSEKKKIPSSIEIKKFTIQAKGNIENKRFFTNFTLSSKTVRYNIHMYEELPRYIEAMWTSLWPIMMWPRCAQNSEVNWIT